MTKTEANRRAVRAWLASHGKTQAWLAKRIGAPASQLSAVLNGHERSDRVAEAITELTGVDLTGKATVSMEANS